MVWTHAQQCLKGVIVSELIPYGAWSKTFLRHVLSFMASWWYPSSFYSFANKKYLFGKTEAFANINRCASIHNIDILLYIY